MEKIAAKVVEWKMTVPAMTTNPVHFGKTPSLRQTGQLA